MTSRWKRYGIAIGIAMLFVLSFFGALVWNAFDRLQRGEVDLTRFTQPGQATRSSSAGASFGVQKVDRLLVESSDDPTLGPVDAAVTIVEFADFQCPFSQRAFPIVKEILAKYQGKVRFIFRDFPLNTIHPDAQPAAEASGCANEQQKFWQLHDLFFINQNDLSETNIVSYANQARVDGVAFAACRSSKKYQSEVQRDVQDGVTAGVTATPTWFVNGWRLEGVLPFETWEKVIEYGLKGKL